MKRSDWNKWKEAIETEIASLTKREVFPDVLPKSSNVNPIGFKRFSSRNEIRTMKW
jgi:hypothetical protein